MSKSRLALLAALSILVLNACGKSDDASTGSTAAGSNDLLTHVPSDTPYVLANLEPVPDAIIDAYLERMQPALDEIQAQLSAARSEWESEGKPDQTGTAANLAHSMMTELDGKLSRTGMESLGLDLRSHKVVYGMGAFPVVRLGLSDPGTLRATILRVLDRAGIVAPEQEYQGVSFWRLSDEDPADVAVGIYLSILSDHLALGILPTMAEDELLPAFLGLDMPANSDIQARLQKLNQTHGYTAHGSGILDMHKMADQFLQPEALAARMLASSGEFEAASLAPECISEIHGIIDHAPRITMGNQELSPTAIAFQYRVETENTLAKQLMGLVSRIPAAGKQSDRIMEFAFGMKFGPVRDFLKEKANAIVESPYRCEHLADLNESALQAKTQLDQPMPPFLNNFLGVRAALTEVIMGPNAIPENARGKLAVHVEKPEMFVGMAQMFLPDLSGLAISPGKPPVELPPSLVPIPQATAFAAMSAAAIGLSVGEGEETGLLQFLDQPPGPEGMFLSVNYDVAAYLDHSENLGRRYQTSYSSDEHSDTRHGQAFGEIRESMLSSFKDMADRSYSTVRFTPGGLVAENRMTFR